MLITTNCWKFLKRWEYQTTLPASWKICTQVKKQQLELDMEKDWFQIGEGVCQGCILSPCIFNLYTEYIMWNARLDEIELLLPQNCTHLTWYAQNSPSQASTIHEPWTSRCSSWIRKGRGMRDQIANICWIMEKAREFQKNIYFCFIDYAKAFDCVDHNKLENSESDGNTRPPDLALEKSVCRSGSNS